MNKDLWKRIEKGMSRAGFNKVLSVHSELPKDVQSDIVLRCVSRYKGYEQQWYTDHNGYRVLFVKEPNKAPTAEDNAYRQPIIDRLDNQTNKGIDKYNTLLHENPLPMPERLEHLAEELTDGLQYIEHIKSGNRKLIGKLVDIVADLTIVGGGMSGDNRREIISIAKKLNGVMKELAGDANKSK